MYNATWPSGCTGVIEDHSTGFVQAKPSCVKFLVFLGRVKYTISVATKLTNCESYVYWTVHHLDS